MNLAAATPVVGALVPVTSGTVVLWGYMGAGKSTVGRALATRLGVAFVDLDEVIAERVGQPVAAFFVAQGERAFREIERTCLLECLEAEVPVLAVGGGTLTDDALRARVRSCATLVTLSVTPEVAARRLTAAPDEAARRPLFDEAFVPRFAARAAAYADADLVISTDAVTPDEVVTAVEGALRARGVL